MLLVFFFVCLFQWRAPQVASDTQVLFFFLRKILHEGTNSKKGKGTASLKKKKIHVCIYISWKCGSPWQQCSAMFFFFSIWFTFPVASARHATLTRKASLGSSESYRFARFYIASCFSLKLSMYADFLKE